MKICLCCGKQYSDTVELCPADEELLKPLTCATNEYLAHFFANLPFGFEEASAIGPDMRATYGDTPLHIAAIQGDIRAIDLLLDAGADIRAVGETGYTPLHYAVEQEKPEAVRLLLERGADPSLRAETGTTPLELAKFSHNYEIEQLLQRNAA